MENESVNQPINPMPDTQIPLPHSKSYNKKNIILAITVLILILMFVIGVYFFNSENAKKTTHQSNNTNISLTPGTFNSEITDKPSTNALLNDIKVILRDGDIFMVKNGKETKITSWGYNSDPVLSPSGDKIAFISKSKESIEYEKTDQGIKRTSTNVWIINADGSNPLQITDHSDYIYRSHPYWIENDKLIYVDGAYSVRVYDTGNASIRTIMGPEKASQTCLDGCGFDIQYLYSPDYTYLIRLRGGVNNFAKPENTAVLNIKTFQTFLIKEEFGVDFESVTFPNNSTLTFQGYEVSDYNKNIKYKLNLSTGHLSKIETN